MKHRGRNYWIKEDISSPPVLSQNISIQKGRS